MDKSKRILIVDDDLDLLDQLTLVLTGEGYEVVRAENQQEGEEALLASKPDLAIFDLMMENRDSGFALCHASKKLHPHTPIILLTAVAAATGLRFATATAEDRAWIKADAFLDKPVRFETLKHEIRRLLNP
jgi:CheY-like chemotaxis protein